MEQIAWALTHKRNPFCRPHEAFVPCRMLCAPRLLPPCLWPNNAMEGDKASDAAPGMVAVDMVVGIKFTWIVEDTYNRFGLCTPRAPRARQPAAFSVPGMLRHAPSAFHSPFRQSFSPKACMPRPSKSSLARPTRQILACIRVRSSAPCLCSASFLPRAARLDTTYSR